MTRTPVTRREFLSLVSRSGGATGLYWSMDAFGMLDSDVEAYQGAPHLLGSQARGQKVVILGAGVAGLTTAYELTKAGYSCVVLEARQRAGGRNWTVRGGDALTEINGDRQESSFDDGLYFNAGPSRISHRHRALLDYCRLFGVQLETFNNVNRAAPMFFSQATGELASQRLPNRAATFDMNGHIAELSNTQEPPE